MSGNNPEISALLECGMRRFRDGKIPEALWDFFQATGNDPQNPLAHYLSGLGLQAIGMEDEAHTEWNQVLALTLHQTEITQEDNDWSAPSDKQRWAGSMALKLLTMSCYTGPVTKSTPNPRHMRPQALEIGRKRDVH